MQKRLQQELGQLQSDQDLKQKGVSVECGENNLYEWKVRIEGDKESAYTEGVFMLEIKIPQEYPFKAPEAKFLTKIYHPNVNKESGIICKDIYAKDWSPVKRIQSIVQSILSMMIYPQLDTPVEEVIAQQFQQDHSLFLSTAHQWVLKYAQQS